MGKIFLWVFLEIKKSRCFWAQGGRAVGVQLDHKVLAASGFDSVFCYCAPRAPVLPGVTRSCQQKESVKNKTQEAVGAQQCCVSHFLYHLEGAWAVQPLEVFTFSKNNFCMIYKEEEVYKVVP